MNVRSREDPAATPARPAGSSLRAWRWPPWRSARAVSSSPRLGALGGRIGLLGPVAAQGSLVVALGATIVGTTLGAVGLGVTREGGTAPRSRAWIGVAVHLGLLLALVVVFARGVGRPLVVEDGEGAPGGVAAAGTSVLDAEALRRLRAEYPDLLPIAVPEPVDVAFERARRTAEALGWKIVERDDRAGRFEARAGAAGRSW